MSEDHSEKPDLFIHIHPKDTCEHKWDGPGVDIDHNRGWSATCSKCGMLAFDHTMRYGE